MATQKPAAPEAAEAPAASGGGTSKKRVIIMVLLALLLVGVSVGGTIGAVKFFGDTPKPEPAKKAKGAEADKAHPDEHAEATPEGEKSADEEPEAEEKSKPIYILLKPDITVSYDVNGRQRFLKVTVNFLTRDLAVEKALTLHSPVVANAIVMTVSNKKYEELQTAEGREVLRKECLAEVNKLIEKETSVPNGVEQVLFSEFIMQ